MQSEKLLVWVDLEMTGLDPQRDVILEMATIITDNNLEIIAQGPEFVIHQPEEYLERMNDWVRKTHTASGLIEQVRASKISVTEAEQQTLDFIQQYCKKNTAPLCGNTVHQDRAFIRTYMRSIDEYLHYRIIDVSSVKELVRRWYPQNPKKDFVKPENHRALEDIKGSIVELAHYRMNFFV